MSANRILDVIAYVQSQADITLPEVAVLTAIANETKPNGFARATLKTLQSYARMGRSTLKRTLRTLECRGALHTTCEGGRRLSSYQLLIPYIDRSKTTRPAPGRVLNALGPLRTPPRFSLPSEEREKRTREMSKTGARDMVDT